MRYGKPEMRERIQALLDQGCDRILLVPLYPQYAAATSATVCDHAFRALMDMRWQPTMRVSPPYHDDPVYIDALVTSMKRDLAKLAVRARGDPGVVPRRAEGIPAEGRSLSLPMRQDLAADARGFRLAAGPVPHELPIPLRSRRVAAALHGQDRRRRWPKAA